MGAIAFSGRKLRGTKNNKGKEATLVLNAADGLYYRMNGKSGDESDIVYVETL